MKRLQIMIEEELYDALERQAREERTSKAALIRRYVREHVRPLPPIDDSVSVDDVVYPRGE
jgi:predicted CopG family antitoxin